MNVYIVSGFSSVVELLTVVVCRYQNVTCSIQVTRKRIRQYSTQRIRQYSTHPRCVNSVVVTRNPSKVELGVRFPLNATFKNKFVIL